MSQERLSMKKLREVLRLHYECHLSNRQIARALKLSATTVGNYLTAAQQCPQRWEDLQSQDDQQLMKLLGPHCQQLTSPLPKKSKIDYAQIHQELKKKGVTRELLHEEYQQHPQQKPISYSSFCRQYRDFKKKLKPSMRQTHSAGEKTFVDYAGPTIPIYDAKEQTLYQAVIFVGVLGASNFTFAEATRSRSLPDWIGSHVRMFEYFGGITEMLIPDNEKSAVSKACYYDPDINPNYTALAAHYQTAIVPTRPYHPKDKAKVEVAVQIVERWILARLRHQKFFSLVELNQAIAQWLEVLNNKPFKKLPGTRRSLYEALDKPALKALPQHPYEFKEIKKAQVNLDYHVEVDRHYYSVPHTYIHQHVDYHLSQHSVAIFYQGRQIAYHVRSYQIGKATTCKEHMPRSHWLHQQWTPQTFLNWSQAVGPNMKIIAHYLIEHQANIECTRRIYLGFLNLAKRYSKPRLEQACHYAKTHGLYSYTHLRSILATQSDQAPRQAANDDTQKTTLAVHENVRGAQYYSTINEDEKTS